MPMINVDWTLNTRSFHIKSSTNIHFVVFLLWENRSKFVNFRGKLWLFVHECVRDFFYITASRDEFSRCWNCRGWCLAMLPIFLYILCFFSWILLRRMVQFALGETLGFLFKNRLNILFIWKLIIKGSFGMKEAKILGIWKKFLGI